MRRWTMSLCLASLALLAGPVAAAPPLQLPRAGQIGVGLQGQFGTLLENGNFGDNFDSGGGYAFRIRYRMRYARALGLSFESQNFRASVASTADTAFKRLRLVTSGVELCQMSDPRSRTQHYLGAGFGLYQSSVRQVNKEVFYFLDPDGLYASLSAGFEHFFFRSWALEVSTRYMGIFQESEVNHDIQASAGVIFYASY